MESRDSKISWLILAMVTLITFLEVGIIKGFSVLLPDLKEHLSSQTWIIGSSISIIYGWGYLVGLSANAVVSMIGVRPCLMLTGLISSLGLLVCALASNELTLLCGMILLGFMLLQENVAVGIIPAYFDKYYHTAVNVYCFGFAIAIIVSPLLTQTLRDMYGWRGTLVLLCGINLQSVVCSAIVKRESPLKNSKKVSEERSLLQERSLAKQDEFDHLSLKTLLQKSLKIYDFQMLVTVPFITRVFVPGLIFGYTFSSWLIYIISFALSKGASIKEASFVAMWGGVGVATIKLALPTLSKYFTYKELMYAASISEASSLAAMAFFHSIIGMSATSYILGISMGVFGTEIYVAGKDVAGEDQYLNAVSWFHLAFGFGSITGATFTGVFFDVTENFTLSFWLLSAVSLITAISLGLEDAWIWRRYQNSSSAPL